MPRILRIGQGRSRERKRRRASPCDSLQRYNGSNLTFNVAKPLALDSVGQKLVKLLAADLQILWRFLLSLRRALLFLPDKSRRPQRSRNPLQCRFGLRRPAIAPRKLLRAGRVIGLLAILESLQGPPGVGQGDTERTHKSRRSWLRSARGHGPLSPVHARVLRFARGSGLVALDPP